jgi:hypothetical protein
MGLKLHCRTTPLQHVVRTIWRPGGNKPHAQNTKPRQAGSRATCRAHVPCAQTSTHQYGTPPRANTPLARAASSLRSGDGALVACIRSAAATGAHAKQLGVTAGETRGTPQRSLRQPRKMFWEHAHSWPHGVMKRASKQTNHEAVSGMAWQPRGDESRSSTKRIYGNMNRTAPEVPTPCEIWPGHEYCVYTTRIL